MKKLLRFACVALLTGALVVACDDDEAVVAPVLPPTPTAPAPIFGTVSGTVSVEGSGLSGVSVNLLGAASQSASTGSSGGYSFGNVPAGTHGVQISGAPAEVAFVTTATVVTITTSGQTATADFSGNYIRTSTITGSVTAGSEGVVATVTATGAGMLMSEQAVVGSSDTDGNFELTGLRAGTYHVAISDFGDIEFPVTTRDVTVGVGLSANVSFNAPGEDQPTTGGTGAFLVITELADGSPDNATYSGRVTATVDIERGDARFETISLYVDGAAVASQSFGLAPAPAEDPELASQQVEFSLSFDSHEYDETGVVTYSNGAHDIVMGLTVQGSTEEAFSNRMEVEFDNADGVHVAVSGLGPGATSSATGQIWYGGPAAAMIEITAVPVLYSGGSATSVGIGAFCGAEAATDAETPFVFTPECKGTSNTDTENMADPAGDTPEFTIAAADVVTLNGDDIFPLYLDFDGPSAPAFSPNPNGREDGWVNLTVDFLGAQKSSNKNGWLTFNDDDAGVGGYQPVLRYAEVPKDEAGLDAAIAAPILTLANLPSPSDDKDEYCAVASAVDLLGNQSALPNAEDDDDAPGTCMIAGVASVEEDNANNIEAVEATGYMALLEAANAEMPEEGAAEALANAGLLVGVDITPPAVEFTSGGPKDEATELGTGWVLHVTDGGSGLASDPIDASIEVRDADGTEDVDEAEDADAPEDGEFVVTANTANTRFTTAITTPAVGYHTFSATATDKAGNETDSGSRVALNDVTLPTPVRLFVVPGEDDFTYNKTLLASDNLSISSYAINVPVGTVGSVTNAEIKLESVDVDAYNASSLTDDLLVRDPVELPFLAVQDGTGTPDAIETIKAYVSDQVGSANGVSSTAGDIATPDADDISQVTFRSGGGGFAVTATDGSDAGATTIEDGDATIEIEATADLDDTSTDFPFSRVDFYVVVEATLGDATVNELRFIGSVDGNSATVKTLDPDGREWTYAAEVDAEAFLAVVDEDDYTSGNVVAFGVSTEDKGAVAVAAVSADLTVEER